MAEASSRIGYYRPMLVPLLAAALLGSPFDFLGFGPYDAAVPEPSQILGYGPGERHTSYDAQERVLRAIADKAGTRMRLVPYGRSTEGRELRIAVLGSAENIARLDAIQTGWKAIAKGGADPAQAIGDLPIVVWINECVHGDETASFESGMWLIYTLAASRSPRVTEALANAVVIVNPVYNPDGHERFVVWYNSVAVGSASRAAFEQRPPSVIGGRTNHYRFDMNRDRVAMSQSESRQEAAEVLRWNPQVYIDQHGEVDTYFFPPCSMSLNVNIGRERYEKWSDVFGRASAAAFDEHGWLYFVRRTFDFYYAGYLDSWNTLTGAIGMTHETDGGSRLAIERAGGGVTTLRDGMAKHLTTALATIETAAARRQDLAREYAAYKASASTGAALGKFRRVIVTSPDSRPLVRLREQLAVHGIAAAFAARPFEQRATAYADGKAADRSFPAGSLVVDLAQPQGLLAKALLEPGSDFEPEFVRRQEKAFAARGAKETYPPGPESEFYDITAWSLVYGHGVSGFWASETPAFVPGEPAAVRCQARYGKQGAFLRYTDRADALAVFDLLAAGVRVDVAEAAMTVGGQALAAGTFLVLRQYNADAAEALARVAEKRGVAFEPLETAYPDGGDTGPGSSSFPLARPRISVVFGAEGGTTAFGSAWFALERTFGIPFTPVTSAALSDPGDATCLVCPPGAYPAPTQALKDWVRAGGSLVVLGRPGWALGERGFAKLQTRDAMSIPGSIFRARLNPRSPFCAGYDPSLPLPVPIDGGTFLVAAPEGGAVVSISSDKDAKNLLSGWAWPDSEEALRGAVWLHDQPVGRGHVFIFAEDPTDRAMWPGLDKLLLNAILAGSGE